MPETGPARLLIAIGEASAIKLRRLKQGRLKLADDELGFVSADIMPRPVQFYRLIDFTVLYIQQHIIVQGIACLISCGASQPGIFRQEI